MNAHALTGYHWDCSDWALINENHNHSNKPVHLLEVSTNEVRDSESNSDNSQIEMTGDDVRRLSSSGLNGRRKGFVGSSSSSLETSLTENNPSSEIRRVAIQCTSNGVMEEDEEDVDTVHETIGLLALDDIEFADRSPSDKYASHPNSYLPIYQSIAGEMEGSEAVLTSNDHHWVSSGDVISTKTKSNITTHSSTDNMCITNSSTAIINGNTNHLHKDIKVNNESKNNHENGYEGASEGSSPLTTNGEVESTFV